MNDTLPCDHAVTLHDCSCACTRFWCKVSRRERFETITETQTLAAVKQRLRDDLIAEGVEFSRCANCGDTYPLGLDGWYDLTVCGERCHDAYVRYLEEDL